MLNPTTGVNRAVRAGALGGTCLLITVLGHGIANGHSSPEGIALLTMVMMAMAVFATARELSFLSLLAFAGFTQVGAHLLLSLLSPATNSPLSATPTFGSRGHDHSAAEHTALTSSGTATELPVSMIAMHLGACVVMAVILRHGEKLYFQLHRALPEILRVLIGRAVPTTPAAFPVLRRATELRDARESLPFPRFIAEPIQRRGPPAAFIVA